MKGWSPRFVLTLGPMSVVNLLSLKELIEGAAGKSIHFSLIDLFIPTWAFVILISPKPRFIVLYCKSNHIYWYLTISCCKMYRFWSWSPAFSP